MSRQGKGSLTSNKKPEWKNNRTWNWRVNLSASFTRVRGIQLYTSKVYMSEMIYIWEENIDTTDCTKHRKNCKGCPVSLLMVIGQVTKIVMNPGSQLSDCNQCLKCYQSLGLSGWRTNWHRHQFDTGVNLTPRVLGGQFDTKSEKESIWHRSQFDTESVKGSIWHRHRFDTGPIWHQECKGVNLTPESIWHRSQFDTI